MHNNPAIFNKNGIRFRIIISVFLAIFFLCCKNDVDQNITGQESQLIGTILDLPSRSGNSYSGTELIQLLTPSGLKEREEIIYSEILSGNIPYFLRQLTPISLDLELNGLSYSLSFYVTPDYMALGSNDDYFIMPMTPIIAQDIANSLGLSLMTKKMVDHIWQHSELKLAPTPIPPSPEMITIPVFADHNEIISAQRLEALDLFPLGSLVAGHKKDVVISNRILENQNKVVIYGWHQSNGEVIQPLYSGHVNWYADYSHGIRFALDKFILNGEVKYLSDILKDPDLYHLLSDEDGPMIMTNYPVDKLSYP